MGPETQSSGMTEKGFGEGEGAAPVKDRESSARARRDIKIGVGMLRRR
jgi:hypothetical protein